MNPWPFCWRSRSVRSTCVAQVPSPRIAAADRTPADWLTYSGNYQAHRFSPLTRSPARTSRS